MDSDYRAMRFIIVFYSIHNALVEVLTLDESD